MLCSKDSLKTPLKTLAIALFTGGLLVMDVHSQSAENENKMYLDFITEMMADMKPAGGIVDEVASEKPLPETVPVEKINQGLRFFQQSFYFKESPFEKDKLELESDMAHVYYDDFVNINVNWVAAKKADGTNVLDPVTNEDAQGWLPFRRLNTTISLNKAVATDVVSVSGVIKVKYPTAVTTVELPLNDFKTEVKVGNATFRLLRLENDLAVVWCSAQTEDFIISPVSASGMVLSESGSSRGPYSLYKEISANGKLSKQTVDKYIKNIDELKNGDRVSSVNAKGKIAKLFISLPSDFKEQTLSIKATPFPDFSENCPKITFPRYAVAKSKLNYEQIDAAKLQKTITIYSSRSRAMFGYNTPVIMFCLPKIANSYGAKPEIKNLVVTKGSNKVKFDPQGPFRGDDGFSFSFRMDNDKPLDFTSAKGVLEINYPVKVSTRTIKQGEEDTVISFDSCRVKVMGNTVEYDKKSPQPQIRAYDTHGNELQVVSNFSSSGYSDGVEYEELRFWGTVDRVEIDAVEKWIPMSIPFDLKPAPLLPKQD